VKECAFTGHSVMRDTSAPVLNCLDILALMPKCLADILAPRKTLRHWTTLDQAMARWMAVLA